MNIGKEMRNGHVLCNESKPVHTIFWCVNSPAKIRGVCCASTSGTAQLGVLIPKVSAICTLSKLIYRNSGCVFRQSTAAGFWMLVQPLSNQLVLATCKASTLALGQTVGVISSSTTTS